MTGSESGAIKGEWAGEVSYQECLQVATCTCARECIVLHVHTETDLCLSCIPEDYSEKKNYCWTLTCIVVL